MWTTINSQRSCDLVFAWTQFWIFWAGRKWVKHSKHLFVLNFNIYSFLVSFWKKSLSQKQHCLGISVELSIFLKYQTTFLKICDVKDHAVFFFFLGVHLDFWTRKHWSSWSSVLIFYIDISLLGECGFLHFPFFFLCSCMMCIPQTAYFSPMPDIHFLCHWDFSPSISKPPEILVFLFSCEEGRGLPLLSWRPLPAFGGRKF